MNSSALSRRSFLNRSGTAAAIFSAPRFNILARNYADEFSNHPNEVIRRARSLGLSILKPSKKEIERGLEIHRESLVFDSYGFAPRCAIDGKRMAQLLQQNPTEVEIQDLREDMGMTHCVTNEVERKEFQQAWEAAGVTCIFQNAGEEGQAPMRLIKRLARFTYLTDMMKDFIIKAATPDEVEGAHKAGKRALYLTGNGVPLTQDWISVPDELRYIRIFYQLGIRMMHMTYNRRNMIGDGCAEPANAGLSDFGKTVVKELNRVGVIADIAHSGWQTSLETAQTSERPMVASHSTCAALYKHIRSKPDNVIKSIADTGGYLGVCCIPSFLGGNGDIAVMMKHIDHIKTKFGADHVAIGTDVAYQSRNASAQRKLAGSRPRFRKQWRSLWPVGSLVPKPHASISMSWTNWPLFTIGMVQMGYSDSDIRKILGGNVMRVSRAVLEEAR
ncbi:MAG: dipeptidase [Verrucomicrobiales bacterium]|nr:dipeptidase [Verrucomicrobiales bacterium]|tara:strand:- start:16421 stop:17755 length:1335 start_codon:yes stop_codon:yes gene_type:complete